LPSEGGGVAGSFGEMDVGSVAMEAKDMRQQLVQEGGEPAAGDGVGDEGDGLTSGRRGGGRCRYPLPLIRAITSARVAWFSRKMPRTTEVTVTAPGFCTPRMVIHRCSASMMTMTPRG